MPDKATFILSDQGRSRNNRIYRDPKTGFRLGGFITVLGNAAEVKLNCILHSENRREFHFQLTPFFRAAQ